MNPQNNSTNDDSSVGANGISLPPVDPGQTPASQPAPAIPAPTPQDPLPAPAAPTPTVAPTDTPTAAPAPVAPALPTQPAVPAAAPAPGVTPAANPHDTETLIADDADLIEKEWVEKAKQLVDQTKADPYKQNKEMNKFKASYIKKRYNKDIQLSND